MHSDKEMLRRSHETDSGGAMNVTTDSMIQREQIARRYSDEVSSTFRRGARVGTFHNSSRRVVSHAIHAGKESSVSTPFDSNELVRERAI